MAQALDLVQHIWALVVLHAPTYAGIVLPPVVDFINKDVHNDQERFIVTILVCLGVATILKWDAITYGTPEEILATAGIIFAESQAVFKLYFKCSTLRAKIQAKLGISPTVEVVK